MPKELPGFYYDPEKNRYFPYKGPIPGSSSKPKPKPDPAPTTSHSKQAAGIRQGNFLQARELCGNILHSRKGKLSFQAEREKANASQPLIWKYEGTKKMANIALEHAVADVTSLHGQMEKDILLSGGMNGLLRLYPIEMGGHEIDEAHELYKKNWVWPTNTEKIALHKQLPRELGTYLTAMEYLTSDIGCIKISRKTDGTTSKHIVITTLGSDWAPGHVYLLDLSKPLDLDGVLLRTDGFHVLAALKHTLWTADCDSEGKRAAIGTNRGAVLLNIETGDLSWVYHCKSDVLSLQLDQSGRSILCGLRNGSIFSVDTRQKQKKQSTRCSPITSMRSSVCCLESLKHRDQYFVASSMDGSIKLYDNRLIQRGAVQSYEGNVNSHTRIQLGVDPSEKVVLSGGEDSHLRLWDIKSGELLFNEKFMNSTPSAVCWPRIREKDEGDHDYRSYWQDHRWGAWLGSTDGIFYMDWP